MQDILKETKVELCNLLQKYDAIISRSDNDIGQTDLIKKHIATKPNTNPIATKPYSLPLKTPWLLKTRN